jgi:hypothetical protein
MLRIILELLLMFLVLYLSGCGKGTIAPQAHGQFEPYFQAFEAASVRQGRSPYGDASLPIVFQSIPPGEDAVAQCLKPGPDNLITGRIVVVDPAQWALLTETQRTETIYHEMSHCLLNRIHTSVTIVVPVPVDLLQLFPPGTTTTSIADSIMNPTVQGDDWAFETYRNYYETELFQNAGH